MFTIVSHPSRGWAMPANFPYDFHTWFTEASDNIAAACKHVAAFRTAVQAGAHVGVWPWLLADLFEEVLAFEPDMANLDCAYANLAGCRNVRLSPQLLGDRRGRAAWHQDTDTGSHRVLAEGDAVKEMTTIDSIELGACDLICLDVEGYEAHALLGAVATIRRYRPVILVENRGHEIKHGLAAFATHELLLRMGYAVAATTHCDSVYVSPPTCP